MTKSGTWEPVESVVRIRTLVHALLVASLLALGLPADRSAHAQAPSPITYVYDETGRLVGAVDPAADTARYSYDSVGNILSIARQASSSVSIIEFTPSAGPPGASVTIFGTGFSTTPSQNAVTFNGTAATVTSSTAIQIVTSVPSAATTGPIAVTAPGGSATSATSFTVRGSLGPTISSFTPTIGTPDTAVTLNGTNFETPAASNRVVLNTMRAGVSTSTSTSLGVTVPPGATSGRIAVNTPYGQTTSTADFFVPPGSYTAADVEATGRIGFGESRTVTISTAGKIGLIVFDGTAGQRISLKLSSVTIASVSVLINNPDGSTLASATVGTSGGFIDVQTLPATGTYTIVLDPASSYTGSATLQLFDVPPDATGTITAGGPPVTLSLGTPGQNAALTFGGTANQRISLKMSEVTIFSVTVSILRPDGSTLASQIVGTSGGFIDVQTLATSGTYTIRVDPASSYTGSITLTLYDVPPDVTGTISAGGSSVTVATGTPGQNATLTFSGTANQRISLKLTSVTYTYVYVSIKNPDGTNLVSPTLFGSSGGFIDTKTLAATGTYSIFIDPYQAHTGSATLTLYDVPPDVTGTITPGGASVTVTTGTPGQNGTLTFSGTANQRVSLRLTSVTYTYVYVSIKNPDGTNLVSPTLFTSSGGFIDTKTLAVTGTYSIFIDPYQAYTGSATLTLYDVPPDVTATITIGGPAVTITTTTPGQNAQLTFSGTASQKISLAMSSITLGWSKVSIKNPDGTTLVSPTWVAPSGGTINATLTQTGTHTILVDPDQANTGSMTLALSQVGGEALLEVASVEAPEEELAPASPPDLAPEPGRYGGIARYSSRGAPPALLAEPPATEPGEASPVSFQGAQQSEDAEDDELWKPTGRNLRGDWRPGRTSRSHCGNRFPHSRLPLV